MIEKFDRAHPIGGGSSARALVRTGKRLTATVGAFGILATTVAMTRAPVERCSMITNFRAPTGQTTFLVARATANGVTADVDTQYTMPRFNRPRDRGARAQLMHIERVGGWQTDALEAGFRQRGDTGVFVRYGITPGCSVLVEMEGAFDRPGTYGLYRASLRARDRWVDGRPTFDVFMYFLEPFPGRLMSAGYVRGAALSQIMTANELFDLYAALWTEDEEPQRSVMGPRACEWIARNSRLARKHPAAEILESEVGGDPREMCTPGWAIPARDIDPPRTPPPPRP